MLYRIARLLLLLAFPISSFAFDSKHAIVIGNSQYAESPLVNPANDAIDMVSTLRSLGFNIHKNQALLDLGQEQFLTEIDRFSASIPNDSLVVFFYAGHGIATRNDNFLIPVGTSITQEAQLWSRAVSVRSVEGILADKNHRGSNIILLDACRNNPFGDKFRGAFVTGGLVRLKEGLAIGSYIGYAASEGQVAADGEERNGVYTSALLTHMKTNPNRSIQDLHASVAGNVLDKTRDKGRPQFPVAESKLSGLVCLGSCQDISNAPGKLTLALYPETIPFENVKIFGSKEPYKPGISLDSGKEYEILIRHKGYKDWNKKHWMRPGPQTIPVSMVEEGFSKKQKILFSVLGILAAGALYSAVNGGDSPTSTDDVGLTLELIPPGQN